MKLPDPVKATRDRYVDRFPLWSMPEGPAAEERARVWTMGLVSQIVFEHGSSYGCKQADPNRPVSKDAVAQQYASGELLGWDMLTGAGSGTPALVIDPDSIDITGQVFVVVQGADVIAGAQAPVEPEGPPPSAQIPYDEGHSVEFGHACNAVYAESGAAMDPGMISVHSQRAAWDYYVGGLSWEESCAKHTNEFRAVYGLSPV